MSDYLDQPRRSLADVRDELVARIATYERAAFNFGDPGGLAEEIEHVRDRLRAVEAEIGVGPKKPLFVYFICKRAARGDKAARWPRTACDGCDCKPVSVYEGILCDEHQIDWTRPENQP